MMLASIADWLDSITLTSIAIAGFLATLATLVKRIISKWKPILDQLSTARRMRFRYQVDHRSLIALNEFVASSGAARALLLAARNCGWRDPSLPVTVSVISESLQPDTPRVFERWQEWKADPAYLHLLREVEEAGAQHCGVLVITEELQPGILQDYYRDTGVVASVVFMVKMTKDKAMIYTSLNFGRLQPEQRDEDRSVVEKTEQQEPGQSFAIAPAQSAEIDKARHFFRFPERVRRKMLLMRSIWEGF